MKRPSLLIVGILVVCALVAGGLYWYNSRVASLPYYSKGVFTYNKAEASPISRFDFKNQDGKDVSNAFAKSSVLVMNYFFTRCGGICPKMTTNLTALQEAFKNEENVKIISLSCDPEFDSVGALAAYAKRYQINPSKWAMVTGSKKELYNFARNDLQLVATPTNTNEENDFIHSPYSVLIDEEGYIRGYYDATQTSSIQQLIIDIKKLL